MNRKSLILVVLSFATGVAVGPWLVASVQAQYRPIKATELMRVDLGSWCPGKEVTFEMQEAGAGTSGRHYHPAHSFSWIIEGSETHLADGKATVTAKPGDLIHDEPMEIHESQNAAALKFLQVRIVEKGKPVTTRIE